MILKIIDRLTDLVFPRRCAVCDELLPVGEKYVCNPCMKKKLYIEEPTCIKCGKSIGSENAYCEDCSRRKHKYIQGTAVFDYGSIADSLFRFKNKGRVEYAKFYAREIMDKRGDWLRAINPDAFVPVPIHSSKLRKRGYNQAEILSDELSKLSKIPTEKSLISRIRKTAPLKDLSLIQRQDYLKKAFKVNGKGVKLKTIVIIDDIYTTGSTVDEIADAIQKVFPCNIYFLTIAIGRGK